MTNDDRMPTKDFSVCQNASSAGARLATTGDNSPITMIEAPSVLAMAAIAVLGGMAARDQYDDGQRTPEQRANIAVLDAKALVARLAEENADAG